MTPIRLTSALLAAALASSDSVRAPTPAAPPRTIAELEARIARVLDSTKTPGMGLAIVRNDSVIYTGGIGRARVAPPAAATAATLFRIGSTSKSLVAITALALEREGKLSLQDPIKKYLPGFYFRNPWEATDPVRIVNLLEHTSGFDDNSLMSYANNDPTPLTLERGLALDSATRVSRWRPGTRFSYCNTGPAIVARIIEVIEGKPFEQVVQERWFTPIGMATATYMRPDTTKVPVATLYHADGITPVPYWYVFVRPAGAISASAHDMAAYVRFLLGRGTIDGKTLLPPEAIARLERSESSIMSRAGLTVGYGLHMYRAADTTGFVWTGHGGAVEGGLSDLSYLPDQHLGYAFQINTGDAGAVREIAKAVRGFLTQGITPPPRQPRVALAAATAARFGGWYRGVSPRTQHLYFSERLLDLSHITFTDSTLRLAPLMGKGSEFVPVGERLFRRRGEPVATLALVTDSANGRAEGTESFGSRLGGSTQRVSALDALGSLGVAALWLAGVALSAIVTLFGALRWIVRRVRGRAQVRAAVATPWRLAFASTLLVCVNVVLLGAGSGEVRFLGNLTALSATLWASGVAFAVLALIGLVAAFRSKAASSRWDKMSLVTARAVWVLNGVAAVYLTLGGYIGWRTWS
ncbi:MAG: serine hydrolase [Gemmatimonadetes bacterium]|nr:serine hydrolase [Gemmatimonadota bacterium]